MTKCSCLVKYFRGLGYPRKFFDGINFYVPRFGDLERDYTRQENVKYKQFATFVATMQLLTIYARGKENRRTL